MVTDPLQYGHQPLMICSPLIWSVTDPCRLFTPTHLACCLSSICNPWICPSTMASSSAHSRLCSSCLSTFRLRKLHRDEQSDGDDCDGSRWIVIIVLWHKDLYLLTRCRITHILFDPVDVTRFDLAMCCQHQDKMPINHNIVLP